METTEGNKLIAEFMGARLTVEPDIFYPKTIRNYAEFEPGEHPNRVCSAGTKKQVSELRYNTSWDWLMPVVEKIEGFKKPHEQTGRSTYIMSNHWAYQGSEGMYEFAIYGPDYVNGSGATMKDIKWKASADNKLEAVWKGCVQFIQWYNADKKAVTHIA